MTDPTKRTLWDPQPTETGYAFAAFLTYLRLPAKSRSLHAAYFTWRNTSSATETAFSEGGSRDTKQAPNTWKEWASLHRWKLRARAWDRHQSDTYVEGVKTQAIANGLHFRAASQHNYLDHHGIVQKARENILANLRDGQLCDRREKTTTYSPEAGWQTVETTTLMRIQARLLEKLEPKIFPPTRAIPTDEDGNAFFHNLDTVAQPGEPTQKYERPYDKKPPIVNLPLPQHVLDQIEADKRDDPDPDSGASAAFPPITVDTPAHKSPHRPNHRPRSAASAPRNTPTAKSRRRSYSFHPKPPIHNHEFALETAPLRSSPHRHPLALDLCSPLASGSSIRRSRYLRYRRNSGA